MSVHQTLPSSTGLFSGRNKILKKEMVKEWIHVKNKGKRALLTSSWIIKNPNDGEKMIGNDQLAFLIHYIIKRSQIKIMTLL